MLDGGWEEDIVERIQEYLSALASEDVGAPAMALNLFDSVNSQLAVLYDVTPTFSNEALLADQAADFQVILELAHWGGLAQILNLYTLGLRECFFRVLWTDRGLRLGIVTPDCVELETVDGSPEDITVLRLASYHGDDPAWEVWDIEDPENPQYRFETADRLLIAGTTAEEYAWADEQGPWIPFVKYRAQFTDEPFSPYAQNQLVYGTLDVAVLWCNFFHVAIKAAWAQRYGIDVQTPDGLVKRTTAGKSLTVEASPTSIALFRSIDGKTPVLSQFAQVASPKDMADAVIRYQSTVLTNLGISPADLENSLAAQSGIAIQLKRSAQRREAMKALPNFEAGDQELFSLIARTSNVFDDKRVGNFPVDGWSIQYHLPGLSADEIKALFEREKEMLTLGLSSLVDVLLAVKTDIKTREEAIEYLRMIRREQALIEAPDEAEPKGDDGKNDNNQAT